MTAAAALTAGYYGKLPGRGDFVRHGWDEATIVALDSWLADGLSAWRAAREDAAVAADLAAAPHYGFFLPPGWTGPGALHGVLSPSVDRAGRFFFLAAGCGGAAVPVWECAARHPEFATAAEACVYTALGPGSDPDRLGAALAEALPAIVAPSWLAAMSVPAEAIFWAETDTPGAMFVVTATQAEPGLVGRLLDGAAA